MTRDPNKELTKNEKVALWQKHEGKCWRCGLPIDRHKRGALHWGHIKARSLGGSNGPSNRAPEHAHCNLESAYSTEIPVAAKVKRVAARDLGLREPKIRVSRKFDGTIRRWTREHGWKDVT